MTVAVVVTWNAREATMQCLESLRGVRVVCVDNGSSDGTYEAVESGFRDVELIRNDRNLGYTGGTNVGIRRALERRADWVLLLNNDAVADAGLVGALRRASVERPDAGVLACKVLSARRPELVEYAGATFRPLLGYSGRQHGYGRRDDGRFDERRDVGRATGAAMAVSRAAIERVGLLDEELFMYVEDVDWCVRIRSAGFAIVFVPDARVYHYGASVFGGRRSPDSLYYHARNTLAISQRHRPLPSGLRLLRETVVVATHLLQARRGDAVRAVLEGRRDYRTGQMGVRM
jgi:GT2 family glycosyltransferase